MSTPQLPPGFVLDVAPPPPPGFVQMPAYERPDAASLRTGDEARNAYVQARRAGDEQGAQTFLQLAERLDREAANPLADFTEGGVLGEVRGQLASAFSTLDNSWRGLKQNFVGAIGSGAAGLLPGPAAALQATMPCVDAWREYDHLKREQSEADKVNAPLNEEYRTGQVLGYVGQAVAPGAALNRLSKAPALASVAPVLESAASALLPTTFRGAALNGATLGYLQPINSEQGEGTRVLNAGLGAGGGILGQAVVPVTRGLLRGARGIGDLFTDAGAERITGGLLRQFADDPARILAPQTDAILGRAPTLAEATLDPGIAQFQRVAQSRFPNVASAISNARAGANQARVDALEQFAGTEAKRAGLLGQIQAAEDAAYGAIRPLEGVDVAPVTAKIDALLSSGAGKRTAVQRVMNSVRDRLYRPDGELEGGVDALIGVRQHIGDLLDGVGEEGAGRVASKQLIAVRDALDEQIRKITGEGLDAALDARRLGMGPINEMDTVGGLLQRTTGDVELPGGQGTARGFRVGEFIRQTDEYGSKSLLDRAAQRGTGFRRADAEGTLSPEALDAVRGVRGGLLAQNFAENAARTPGSPTAQLEAGQQILAGIGPDDSVVANMVREAIGGRLGLLGRLSGAEARIATAVQDVLTNPQRAAEVLRALPPAEREIVQRLIAPAATASGTAAGLTLTN